MFGISVNSQSTNKRFAEKIGVSFPLLSDTRKSVSKDYGVLYPILRIAKRVTFVIDKEGIIRHIEEGSAALDPTAAGQVCRLLGQEKAH